MDKFLIEKFLMDEATEAEIDQLNEWVRECEENEKEFQKAYNAHILLTLAESKKETKEELERYRKDRLSARIRKIVAFSASIAAAVALGMFINWQFFTKPLEESAQILMSFNTKAGQRASLTLPDGTVVDLNSCSTIQYPAVFSKDERRVKIEGEAMFDVAESSERPFLVETYAYDVKVLGTRFNIIAEEETGEFCTALMDGSLAILDKDSRTVERLEPDQVAKVVDGRLEKIQSEDVSSQYRWVEGVIDCSGLGFDEMMRKFERSFGVKIVIDRDDIPDVRLKRMKVNVNDGVAYAFSLLKLFVDFEYEYDDYTNTYHIR